VTTFDSTRKDSGITLSNGDLTASSVTDAPLYVFGTTGKSTGKFSFTVSTPNGFDNNTFRLYLSNLPSSGAAPAAGYLEIYRSGSVWVINDTNGTNNNFGGNAPSSNPDILTVHVDITARKVYFSLNGGAYFNSADPVAGTGGFSIPGTGDIYPAARLSASISVNVTINFFPTSLPSGFSSWDAPSIQSADGTSSGTGAASGVGVALTGTRFDPLKTETGLTLSNNDLTVSGTGGAGNYTWSTTAKTTGKYSFEITSSYFYTSDLVIYLDQQSGASAQPGQFTDAGVRLTYLDPIIPGWGWNARDTSSTNFFDTSHPITNGSTNTVRVHVDFTARKIYYEVNGSLLYGADPVAGTGGISMTTVGTHKLCMAVSIQAHPSSATVNFNPTSLPSGYTGWDYVHNYQSGVGTAAGVGTATGNGTAVILSRSTFDSVKTDAGLVLSNGNRTVAGPGNLGSLYTWSTTSKSTGKYSFAFTSNNFYSSDVRIWIDAQVGTNLPNQNANGGVRLIYIDPSAGGQGWGVVSTVPANTYDGLHAISANTSYTIRVHADFTADRVYFELNGSYLFGGDPVAGTGGIVMSPAAVQKICIMVDAVGPNPTGGSIDFAPTSLPSGFTAWDETLGTSAGTSTASAVGAVAPRGDAAGTSTVSGVGVAYRPTLKFSAANSATATTVSIPTHEVGDLIVIYAMRENATPPTLASGFTSITTNTTTLFGSILGYRIATATNTTSGTWTNAQELIVHVYKPRTGGAIRIGSSVVAVGTSTTLSWSALTPQRTNSTSWIAAFGGHRSINTTLESPPTGMVLRNNLVDSLAEVASFDTNGAVNSFALSTKTPGGTASGWGTIVVEIQDLAQIMQGSASGAGSATAVGNAVGIITGVGNATGNSTVTASPNISRRVTSFPGTNPASFNGVATNSDGSIMYAAPYNDCILKSVNYGVTWTQLAGTSNFWQGVATSHSGQVVAAMVPGGSIWVSTDYGASWTEATSAGSHYWLSIEVSGDGSTIIAGDADTGGRVYVSHNSGTTFTAVAGSHPWLGVASSSTGSVLYAVGDTGNYVQKSTNGGTSWSSLTAGPTGWNGVDCSSDGQTVVIIGSGNAAKVSTNGGTSWADCPTSGSFNNWSNISVSDTGQYIVLADNTDYIWFSSNYGTSFVKQNQPGFGQRIWISVDISSDGQWIIAGEYDDGSGKGQIYVINYSRPVYASGSGTSSGIGTAAAVGKPMSIGPAVVYGATLATNDTNVNMSFRVVATVVEASDGHLRITFQSGSGGTLGISHASFGKWDTNTGSADTTGTPIKLTFGGADTFQMSGTVTSDYVNHSASFSLVPGEKIVVIYDTTSFGDERYSGSLSGVETWFKVGTSWSTPNVTGFTKLAATNYSVIAIESVKSFEILPYAGPTVRSVSNTAYVSTSSLVLNKPTGTVDGDIMIAHTFSGVDFYNDGTFTAPAGWTLLTGFPTAVDVSNFYGKMFVYWKRASSEGSSYTFTQNRDFYTQGEIITIQGAVASGDPIDVIGIATGLSQTSVVSSVTTSADNELVLYLSHDWEGNGALSPPAGFTEILDGLIYSASRQLSYASATGSVAQVNGNLGAGAPFAASLIAIEPAIASVSANITVSGIVANSAVGSPTQIGISYTAVSGVTAGTAISAPTTQGTANKSITGVSAATQIGTVSTIGSANKALSGVSASSAVGVATDRTTSNVAVSGVAGSSVISSVTTIGRAVVSASGVQASTAVGIVAKIGNANILAPSTTGTGQVGGTVNSGTSNVALSGVSAASAIGTTTNIGNGNVLATSASGSADVGVATGVGTTTASIVISGVSGTATANAATIGSTNNISLSGASAATSVGSTTESGSNNVNISSTTASTFVGSPNVGGQSAAVSGGVSASTSSGTTSISSSANVPISGANAAGAVGSPTKIGSANVAITSVSASGQAQTLTGIGSVQIAATGVQGATSSGSPTVSGEAFVAISGASASVVAQSNTVTTTASATVIGVVAGTSAGTTNKTTTSFTSVNGVTASINAGQPANIGNASAAIVGVSGSSAASPVIVASAINTGASVVGVSGTGSTGATTVSTQSSASIAGIQGNGVAGSPNATGFAITPVVGVSSSAVSGTTTESGSANVQITGASANALSGALTETGSSYVNLTGVSASGVSRTTSVTGSSSIGITGVQTSSSVGTTTETFSANVSLTSASAQGLVGTTEQAAGTVFRLEDGVVANGQAGLPSVIGHGTITINGASATAYTGTTGEITASSASVAGVATTGIAGSVGIVGRAVVDLQGASATAQTSNAPVSVTSFTSISGESATAQIGIVTIGNIGITLVDPQGVNASGNVGVTIPSITSSTNISGTSASTQVGITDQKVYANVSLLGTSASSSVGNVIPAIQTTLTGVSSSGQVGTSTVSSSSAASILGVQSAGAVRPITGVGSFNTTISGVEANGSTNDLVVLSTANSTIVGASAAGLVTGPTVTGNAATNVSGVSAAASAGIAASRANTSVVADGVQATVIAGSPIENGDANVLALGVAANSLVGNSDVNGDTWVSLTGISASGQINSTSVRADADSIISGVSGSGQVSDATINSATYADIFGVSAQTDTENLTARRDAIAVPIQGVAGGGTVSNVSPAIAKLVSGVVATGVADAVYAGRTSNSSIGNFGSSAAGKSNTRPGMHRYVQNARPYYDHLKPRLPRYRIPASQMVVMEFVVPTGGKTKLFLVHTGKAQDYSAQAWISAEPDGRPVTSTTNMSEKWFPNRRAINPVIVFDQAISTPHGLTVGLPPGRYFLNILNVSNEPNEVGFWLETGIVVLSGASAGTAVGQTFQLTIS
jgi:hypothetical protein